MEIKHVFAPVTTAKLSALDPDTTYMIELEAKLPSNIFITVGSTELKTSSGEYVFNLILPFHDHIQSYT